MRTPVIVIYYNRYLTNNDCAMFVKRVVRRYSNPTLERLVSTGDHVTRRAAVLALSLVGDYTSNPVLGRALVDRDRGVRTIAETGIRELWCRIGTRSQQETLREVSDLNDQRRHSEAARLATELIHNCHQALEINPYHFTAAAGMGQCYMLQDNPVAALEAFRRALRLNPGLEEVRAQVVRLQRSLKKD
jgi:hypothetical protein